MSAKQFKDVPTLKELGYNVVVDAPIMYLDGPDTRSTRRRKSGRRKS